MVGKIYQGRLVTGHNCQPCTTQDIEDVNNNKPADGVFDEPLERCRNTKKDAQIKRIQFQAIARVGYLYTRHIVDVDNGYHHFGCGIKHHTLLRVGIKQRSEFDC